MALRGRYILSVTTSTEQNSAVEAARDLRSYVKGVEIMRKALTDPLLTAQRRLKALADDHCAPLIDEQGRIENLVSRYQEAERKRVAEEEAKRRVEIERLEQERREAARKAQAEIDRMERERVAADNAARDEAAKAKSKKAKAEFEAAQAQREEEDEARMMAAAQALESAERATQSSMDAMRAPKPEVEKSKGVATQRVMVIEVTDLAALYASRPDLVRLEANFAGIRATCNPEMVNIPGGLKLTWEFKSTARAW